MVLVVLAASCVDDIPLPDAPCDVDRCLPGYRCCSGTCIAADRCTECVVNDAARDASPACDCDSFQPMCVGARWVYEEFDLSTEAFLDEKTHVITDFADPRDPMFDKSGFNAFEFCRKSDDSLKSAWQTVDGARTVWQMHRWFGPSRQLTRTAYYLPSRLRLDQSRPESSPPWTETYTWVTIVVPPNDAELCNDNSVPTPLTEVANGYQCTGDTEQWNVLSFDAAEARGVEMGGRDPLDVLCHAVDGSNMKIFCFARGVGKFFELDVSVKREQLVSYDVPGCDASP